MSSRILEFYRLEAPDSERRMIREYWQWSDAEIEQIHDFIQWMFPLDEPSSVNPDAPLLTTEDRAAFCSDSLLQGCLRKSEERFLNFLGLQIGPNGVVGRSPNFRQRIHLWKYSNHNWLRITRMLKSLRLLGFENEAKEVWKCLRKLHDDGYVSERSFGYWNDAADGLDAE